MKDFFNADSPLLAAGVDRFTWVGSKVPELVFLYEIRKSYDEGNLFTVEELLNLAENLDVDIWPLQSWASRGHSLEHHALLDLYNRAVRALEVQRIQEVVRDIPGIKLTEEEIENLGPEEVDQFLSELMAKAEAAKQAEQSAFLQRIREERAAAEASKTPEQIAYEQSTSRILDITFSLKSAIQSEEANSCRIISERAEEVLNLAPASLRGSSIYLSLKDLITKAKEISL